MSWTNIKIDDVTIEEINLLYHLDTTEDFVGLSVDLFEEAVERLKREAFDEIHPYSLRLYRAVSVPYVLNPIDVLLNRNFIGSCWTYDKFSARVMRDIHNGYGDVYIYETLVPGVLIDWVKTIALHMIPVRGTYEREIRIKQDKMIGVHRIYNEDYEKIADCDELNGKYFFTENCK